MARRLVMALPVLLFLTLVGHCHGGKIGVCYGRNADDLPAPDKVAQLIKQQSIKYVRIYDTNIDVIKAFANTGVELMVGVPNSDLLAFSQYQSNVDTWLKNSIMPYYPATMITYITVGAEVTESPVNVSALVVPAMRNVHTALKKVGLHKKITISSTHSLGILSRSFPPSAGAFNSSHAYFLKPLLEFLVEHQAPFMVDLYPYYAYQNSPSNVSLNYALFSPQSQPVIDPNTGLVYTNMFDAQVDSIFFALMALNFKTLKIMITESGWPNKGAAKETGATPDNAQTYNTNLIRHVVNDSGTPAKPGEEIDVYIFSLFNENRKPGIESERNWGLFSPDQSPIYSLDWTGRGNVDVMTGSNITSSNGTWCIASANATEAELQNGLNWACGPGNVDCSAIQPSQPCYQPDTLASHASYAFNSYYQQNGANVVACDFGGAGVRTTKDPSKHPIQDEHDKFDISPSSERLQSTTIGQMLWFFALHAGRCDCCGYTGRKRGREIHAVTVRYSGPRKPSTGSLASAFGQGGGRRAGRLESKIRMARQPAGSTTSGSGPSAQPILHVHDPSSHWRGVVARPVARGASKEAKLKGELKMERVVGTDAVVAIPVPRLAARGSIYTEPVPGQSYRPVDKMSWQTYVDDHLMCEIEGHHLTSAAIIGHDGTVWAQSTAFPSFKPEEMANIMKDFDEPGFLAPTGLFLGPTKYMVIQGEPGAVIRGKKGSGGVTVKKTGQALVIGIYDEPMTPGQCNMVVERLGDYLVEQGL
ncbi:hypothetical protein EJB05_17045 [Eragrostis curvula]|uniref:Profilin n=1 Tax=Eragrostis curvula TaxID=38414 RepID=A0A5J9VHH5_9POAL|nr:hypothetical protein EJB05_17045 [Eragrostis curvula]